MNVTLIFTYLGVESFSTLPRWIDEATKINTDNLKVPGTRLCIRETKWTTPVLKLLHEGLKSNTFLWSTLI